MCAERIKRQAKRCMHCHAELGDADKELAAVVLDRKLAGEWGCQSWEVSDQVASRVEDADDDIPQLEQLRGLFEAVDDGALLFVMTAAVGAAGHVGFGAGGERVAFVEGAVNFPAL